NFEGGKSLCVKGEASCHLSANLNSSLSCNGEDQATIGNWKLVAVTLFLLLALPSLTRGQRVSFIARRDFAIAGNPQGPQSAVAGDFNGDGKLDLAVTTKNPDSVLVLLGNG